MIAITVGGDERVSLGVRLLAALILNYITRLENCQILEAENEGKDPTYCGVYADSSGGGGVAGGYLPASDRGD